MYSMVLVMALGNSAAIPSYHAEEVSNHVRYGNHLQTEHYRFGRRRGGCCGCCGGGYGGGCYGGGCYGGSWGGCTGGYAGYAGGCTGGYAGYAGGCAGGHVIMGSPGTSGYVMEGATLPYGSAYMGEVPYGTTGGVMTMPSDRSRYDSGSRYERRDEGTGEPTDRGERRDNRGNDRRDNSRDRGNRESRADAPATLVVTLPANARLTVDGQPTHLRSDERTFETPPLATDKDFSYTLKAEILRDGRPVTVTRHVTVRGGEESRVDITFPQATASR